MVVNQYAAAFHEIESIFESIGWPIVPAQLPPRPPCFHLAEDPITAGETARLGLSTLRTWRLCNAGEGVKASDGHGYICGCAPWPDGGCGGCPSYVAGSSPEN